MRHRSLFICSSPPHIFHLLKQGRFLKERHLWIRFFFVIEKKYGWELMAVEARHLSLFPPQILCNRELVINSVDGIGNVHGTPMAYGMVAPLSGTTAETVVPSYGSPVTGNFPAKTAAIKSDSGITYAVPASRKRSRDALNHPLVSSSLLPSGVHNQIANNRCGSFTFLGEDLSFQFLEQQLEIDRFIAQQTEKMRMEAEERRKRYSRRIAATVEESILRKLKAKEDEIAKIGKLNLALEEKVKSLCVENQLWRDLAQSNEATANALRCNLEQVLARAQDDQQPTDTGADAALMDDAQSCCGSNFEDHDHNGNGNGSRVCRKCGKRESCVLLLPCRHLCLCTVCGLSLHTCPVCNSVKTASVHVNLSPS